jgi:RNA polymerase sigma-70 factor (ECF subfamily)
VELVRRSLAGEAAAQEALYETYARRVAGYFLRSGFVRADADDLTQETFVRAFRSLHTFDPDRGAFGAWVSTIARNVARRRWSRRPGPDCFDPELAEEVLPGRDDESASPAAREEIDVVRACVAELPPELGAVVRLRYVDSRTTRGIGEALGMPEATVRLRLREAQALLETALRKRGVVE